jgi:hypothetical protein
MRGQFPKRGVNLDILPMLRLLGLNWVLFFCPTQLAKGRSYNYGLHPRIELFRTVGLSLPVSLS